MLMNAFQAEPEELKKAMIDAASRAIHSGWYILGNEVSEFERQWAFTCGSAHAVGVGNGMDAIEIILRGLNIGPGDEVITTPMTAFATVLAILRAGATPVLADIDMGTALMSIASAQRCISKKTKAVLLVHLYGQVRNMNAWTDFCLNNKIMLIEDCAQSHIASWKGRVAGTFGVAGAYSFYPTKNLGALGDAGMLITSDPNLANRSSQIRNYGQSVRYEHPEIGMNSRLDEMQAAILLERLKYLSSFTDRRRQIANAYQQDIASPYIKKLLDPEEPAAHVHHLYVIQCEARDALQEHLKKHQIQSLIHYPIPIHQQKPCLDIKRDPLGLGNSENHAKTCLSLPCHPQLSDQDVVKVIDVVNQFSGA